MEIAKIYPIAYIEQQLLAVQHTAMKSLRLFGGRLKSICCSSRGGAAVCTGPGDVLLYYVPAVLCMSGPMLASALGMMVTEMELFPFGCAAKMDALRYRGQEIMVAAALANMALACAIFVDKYAFPIAVKTASLRQLALGCCEPAALPLDGGHRPGGVRAVHGV